MDNLSEVYLSVYQELDEVRGGGRIDPVSDFPHHSERGSRRPKDAELKMSPLDRAEARANALKKRNDPEATRRANRITSRFVGPTKRGLGRAIDASNTARFAEKKRLMNAQESYELFDAILEYLVAEGYADTNDAAIAIMANMSEEWKQSIAEEYQDFPTAKVMKKAGDLMGSSAGKTDPKSKKKEKRGIKMMDTMMQHSPDR
jgi:hypothetical protein